MISYALVLTYLPELGFTWGVKDVAQVAHLLICNDLRQPIFCGHPQKHRF